MAELTPMMKHYKSIKAQYEDTLIFYRLGDFYELFFEDAKVASKELDLVLTGRNAGQEEKAPMCGVPHHAVTHYIQRLIQKGYKVAIVEQLEDPALAQGLVKRDVVRVITPGTVLDESLDERVSVYLASIEDYQYGLAVVVAELATGQVRAYQVEKEENEVLSFLREKNVKEVVVTQKLASTNMVKRWRSLGKVTVSLCDEDDLPEGYESLYEGVTDSRFLSAFGRLLHYLEATQKQKLTNLEPLVINKEEEGLVMDYSTKSNLELTVPLRSSSSNITLWSFLDHCRSSMGSRLLRRWIEYPLMDVKEIEKRLDAIGWLNQNFLTKERLKEDLDEVYDVERLVSRIALGSMNAKECVRLDKTLSVAPEIIDIMTDMDVDFGFKEMPRCSEAKALIHDVFVDDPPLLINEGGMFREGYNEELDHLRDVQKNAKKWLLEFENQEKEKTGIKNLKIGYNRVFGYYIEISKGNLPLVKDEWGYIRRQTLTNSERFITQTLKEKEDEILHAGEKAVRLESELFSQLMTKMKEHIPSLQKLAKGLALADALYSLSEASSKKGYVRPIFHEDRTVDIEGGRHPIVESVMVDSRYVSNDLKMDDDTSVLMITGPNMGGKSTYMRQIVLMVILAQIGCYVPAKKAELPIFDQIFTRMGASDDLMAGQSTFMVEMNEANHALKNATEKSLIVFDEIGRGTATYDGMALAQAILEYVTTCVHAKTLFSTHYHELTALEEVNRSIRNVHVAVKEKDGEVTFLYQVKPGSADKSYGIHVAKLANLPESVLTRANELLHIMEQNGLQKRNAQSQMVFMEKVPDEWKKIEEMIRLSNPNEMTPMQALQFVMDCKEIVEKKKD